MLATLMSPPTSLAGRTVHVVSRRFPSLFGAAVWPYVVMASTFIIINIVFRQNHPASERFDPIEVWRGMSIAAKLGVVVSFVACASIPHALALGGVTLLAYADYRGEESSLGSALQRVIGRLLSIVIMSFLIGVGAVFGSFLFVLPGLMFTVFTLFAVPVMMVEGAGVATALRRSIRLTADRIGTILLLLVTLFIAVIVVEVIFGLLISMLNLDGLPAVLTFWGLFLLVAPTLVCIYGTVVTLLYHDIRVSRGELQIPQLAS